MVLHVPRLELPLNTLEVKVRRVHVHVQPLMHSTLPATCPAWYNYLSQMIVTGCHS